MNHIQNQIQILSEIQTVVRKKHALHTQLDNIPSTVNILENQFKKYLEDEKKEKATINKLEKKCSDIEYDMEKCSLDISKSKEKLLQVKSNKEYQSILKEIDSLEDRQFNIESMALDYMERIENLRINLKNIQKLLTIQRESLEVKKKEVSNKILTVTKSIENLDKEINDALASIDAKTLAVYKKTLERITDKDPVMPVVNSICTGCNMSIPAQLSNELQKFKEFKFCPHCRRIIYWSKK